ncbi:hypothetical protein [Streptomyces sp. NBC_01578]|uniref:hypothetical protein n=1 Tax=Streptomyces sp. NBC_01578 TaxID=2975884 RepID=UPI00386FD596
MSCEAAGFGRDLGIDVVHSSVAVFEDVVVVIEFGEPLSQWQLMSVALVNTECEPLAGLPSPLAPCAGSMGHPGCMITAPRRPGSRPAAPAGGETTGRGHSRPDRRDFIYFWPLYTGMSIPENSWRNRMWLDTWI